MDSSDFSNRREEDEDIRLFREEYPYLYDFVLKVLDGNCDEATLQAFKDDYGEEILNDILKIISGKASEKDIQVFIEEYSDEIYKPILKMIRNRKPPREDIPKSVHSREKFKKGDFIGQKYEVHDVLGIGGFGIVYLVYSHKTKSAYALKTFRDEYLEDITTRERFRKEAQVWIELERHPYLVRAHFVEKIAERIYIAMEHIAPDDEGLNTLEGYLRSRPPDLAQTLRWSIQFCHGMEHAYSKGIKAHRDIKPANIMISSDKTIKISDFGLAGVIGESKSISGIKLSIQQNKVGFSCQTMEDVGFGTPTHMPPEQFINAAGCDERSDIYSFGVVLYQMASGGKLPFLASLPINDEYEESRRFWIEMYKLHEQAPIPKINTPLSPIIIRCLEKNPINRYFSFKELRQDFETLLKKLTGEVVKVPELKELEAWELYNKGFSLDWLGKSQDAIACFDRAIKINPRFADAWYNKGAVLGRFGKHREAIACYDKALEINPRDAVAWCNKGNSLNRLGKPQEAIACCDRVLEINSRDAVAWNNKGFALGELDKYQEAIACYNRVLEIDPRDAVAWCNKGNSLNRLGKPQEAIACYDRVLEIESRDADAWYNKGNTLGKLGKYQEAIACYDRSLEINSRYAAAWYIKALVEDKIGRRHDAAFSYKRFIELAPTQYAEQVGHARKRLSALEEK